MDGKKISELTDINSLTDNDEFLVVNKEVTSGTNAVQWTNKQNYF